MALFGFNKQKVLANAEKYVQQGKLQNAISEYEKVTKNDPKDLTVTNTIGDLYSRLGETDKATGCFKTVGDAYASQGFTVKAIAMYKKICKLQPSLESLLKLAELYSQQGLFNDARAQYLQVAEEFLKGGELENAVRIFQKILEMDPENSNMRVRLAEVYIRLGKKTEAWQIFSAAAESLRSKGSLPAADEVLQRMLTLDPGNAYALLMQGKNLVESGDAAGAVATLQKVSDIDSNPDGLRDLLKAYLLTGQLSDAGTVANKLLTVHNDLPAIATFADALMQAGQYENALQVFDQHAERLLAENSSKVLDSLHSIIGHVRDNPDSLQKLLDLFNKAGETTHVSEVMELLAHASVQSGDLSRSRDLYQKLAQLEPQNSLHMQNYQQVVSQLGGTSGSKLITPEEAVVLLDDLEATAPSVHQHYSDEVALSIRSALTDAELFISYNMPAKALGPLVGALPMAPDDLRINQRLASLHTRAERFAEAAVCCRTLQRVYSEAGYPEEATRYGELAERYEDRSSTPTAASTDETPIYLDAPALDGHADPHHAEAAEEIPVEAAEAEDSVPEFSIDEAPVEAVAEEPEPQPEVAAHAAWPKAAQPAEPEFAVVEESSADGEQSAGEIDLSSEWDDALTVESDAPVETAPAKETSAPVVAAHAPEDSTKVDETIEEIRFYLAHGMPEQAVAALAKLQTLTSDQARLAELRAEVDAAVQAAAAAEEQAAAEPMMEELTAEDVPSAEAVEEIPVAVEEIAAVEPEAPAVEEIPIVAEAAVEAEPEPAPEPVAAIEIPIVHQPVVHQPVIHQPVAQHPVAHEPAVSEAKLQELVAHEEPKSQEPVAHEPAVVAEAVVAEAQAEPASALQDFVTDLESSLGDSFLPGTVAKTAELEPAPPAHAEAAVAETQPAALGEFVADIEASLGEDFLKAAPVPEPEPPAAAAKAKPAPPVAAPVTPAVAPPATEIPIPQPAPLAASAAASASSASPVAPVAPAPAASIAWHAPVVAKPQPPAPPAAPIVAPPAAAKSSPFGEDAGVDLAEMFGELKQDLEADVASADEDPETHYNLGIAFREMGLLDEAIGELQKACQSFDRGHAFPQIMQTYTWLAQCFLEKGVPEAAVRWYEKALNVNGIDGETRVALYYELGGAFEASGDKKAALKHFTSVYSSNIDYRDVAERIKALKS
jgi:tetratricopeptide (TPR) repeat protein